MHANRTQTIISLRLNTSPTDYASFVRHTADRHVKTNDVALMLIIMLISGGVTALNLDLSITLLIAAIFLAVYKLGNQRYIPKKPLVNATVALILIIYIFLVKFGFGEANQTFDKYGLYLLNIFTALLVLMIYVREPAYLLKVIHAALLAILLHALLSFFLWFVVNGHLQYSESLKSFTFGYVLFYGHAETFDGLSATANLFGVEFRRNYGIFWEPGILQIYMNLLMFLSLYVFRSNKIAVACVFVTLTTWSSTGLFILTLQLIYYALVNVKRKRAVYAIAIAIPLVGFMGMLTITNLDEKISGKDAGSGYARALDTLTALNIAAANPFFGIALDTEAWKRERLEHHAVIQMEGTRDTRDPSDTNSVLNYFVFFGVPIGFLILTMFYYQRLILVHKEIFFLILCVSLSTEPLGFSVFFLMFILSPVVFSSNRSSRRL